MVNLRSLILALLMAPGLCALNTESMAAPLSTSIDDVATQAVSLRSSYRIWQQIHWKNSLLLGLEESRRSQRPLLVWIVGANPGDSRVGVFAGAIREAVFADPEIIKLVNRSFVGVAIKAPLFHSPTQLDALLQPAAAKQERTLYDRLRPSAPAHEGLCIVDSSGRPLSWVLNFSDRDNMLRYFADALAMVRNQKFAPSKMTERWSIFPSDKLADAWTAPTNVVVSAVPAGTDAVLANPGMAPGSLTVTVVGRALDTQGKPINETIHQENYIEDELVMPRESQAALFEYLNASGARPISVPQPLVQQLVARAFLGPTDINPVTNPRRAKVDINRWDLKATLVPSAKGTRLFQLKGTSNAAISAFGDVDGGNFHNGVTLNWDGFIEFRGRSIYRIALIAQGTEKIVWRPDVTNFTSFQEFRELNKGRPINTSRPVKFGFIAGYGSKATHELGTAKSSASKSSTTASAKASRHPHRHRHSTGHRRRR